MQAARHLLITHLNEIAQRTGLEPGTVNTQDPALLRAPMVPGYWLIYDAALTGSHYHQHLGWVWVLETTRGPADARREQPYTDRREIPAWLAEDIVRPVAPGEPRSR